MLCQIGLENLNCFLEFYSCLSLSFICLSILVSHSIKSRWSKVVRILQVFKNSLSVKSTFLILQKLNQYVRLKSCKGSLDVKNYVSHYLLGDKRTFFELISILN